MHICFYMYVNSVKSSCVCKCLHLSASHMLCLCLHTCIYLCMDVGVEEFILSSVYSVNKMRDHYMLIFFVNIIFNCNIKPENILTNNVEFFLTNIFFQSCNLLYLNARDKHLFMKVTSTFFSGMCKMSTEIVKAFS